MNVRTFSPKQVDNIDVKKLRPKIFGENSFVRSKRISNRLRWWRFRKTGGFNVFARLFAMSRSSCGATVVNTVTATGKTKEKIVYEKCADKRLFTILIITITKKLIKTQRPCLSLLLVRAYRRPGSGVHVYTVAVAITTDSASSQSVPIARHARGARDVIFAFKCVSIVSRRQERCGVRKR